MGRLNPAWNEDQSSADSNRQFSLAMALTGTEFIAHVSDLATRWWPARSGVAAAVEARLQTHPSGAVVALADACPWQSHLFDIELEVRTDPSGTSSLY